MAYDMVKTFQINMCIMGYLTVKCESKIAPLRNVFKNMFKKWLTVKRSKKL